MEAARYGCADAVNALVAAGADVKLKDKNGKTALALADRVRHPEIVAALKAATPGHRWWPF
jgi:ankyrin repeat protein